MCEGWNLTASSLPGQYFASIMIIVGMSVVATVVVLQYHHHDPNGGDMPKWVRPPPSADVINPCSGPAPFIHLLCYLPTCT